MGWRLAARTTSPQPSLGAPAQRVRGAGGARRRTAQPRRHRIATAPMTWPRRLMVQALPLTPQRTRRRPRSSMVRPARMLGRHPTILFRVRMRGLPQPQKKETPMPDFSYDRFKAIVADQLGV